MNSGYEETSSQGACSNLLRILLALVLVSLFAPVYARLKDVGLKMLVVESDVIVVGMVPRTSSVAKGSAKVPFDVTLVLKGRNVMEGTQLRLCNARIDSENPDLATQTDVMIVFAKNEAECARPSWGYISTIPIRGGIALSTGLVDQPGRQNAVELLAKIRSLIDKG